MYLYPLCHFLSSIKTLPITPELLTKAKLLISLLQLMLCINKNWYNFFLCVCTTSKCHKIKNIYLSKKKYWTPLGCHFHMYDWMPLLHVTPLRCHGIVGWWHTVFIYIDIAYTFLKLNECVKYIYIYTYVWWVDGFNF